MTLKEQSGVKPKPVRFKNNLIQGDLQNLEKT